MEKKIFLFFVFTYCYLIFIDSKIIKLPFKTHKYDNLGYIESLLKDQLYTPLEIGEPIQNINLSLSMETNEFSVESNLIKNNFYKRNKSITYKKASDCLYFYSDKYSRGYSSNETFYFETFIKENKKEKFQNIQFFYITEAKQKYIDNKNILSSGFIGLQLSKTYSSSINIFKSLNNINATSKNIWNFFYSNDKEGMIIIGEYPHQYNNDKYKEYDIKRTNAIVRSSDLYWGFLFSDIIYGKSKLNKERFASLSPQLGLIISPPEYESVVHDYFFKDLILQGKCVKKTINYPIIYKYFECNTDTDVSNFKDLIFKHQELSYNFTLNKNDLFVDYKGKKYFLCVFPESKNIIWNLGTPFLKKYEFTFNIDSKVIIFYDNNKDNTNFIVEKINSFGWTIIFFLIIAILILSFLIIRKIVLKSKRIAAKELENSFSYKIHKEDKEKPLNIESNSKLGI